MKELWPALRLVKEGICSRHDLETHYSIDDVQEDNFMLDAFYEAEARHLKRQKDEARPT